MKKSTKLILLFTMAVFILLFISNCGGSLNLSETASNNSSPTITSTVTSTLTPTPQGTPDSGGGITVPGLSSLATSIPTIIELIPTRTPAPTATPDAISEAVSQIIHRGGASGKTLLWLKYADWVNLAISLFFVFVGYLTGTWMIRWLLPRLVRRTKTKLDDRLLQVSGNQLRWLAVLLIFRSSIGRLTFVSAGIKTFITDITFFLSLFLVIGILWSLIDLVAREAEMRARKSGQQREAESLITLSVWTLRFFVFIFLITLTLGHFAVNITGFALFLGIVVLVLSLASRDLLADLISGAMILVDRPYRIGDRLELPSMNSWGDVVEIGMRSTKILSMENRMVVLPNSVIGKGQVVNYSYPDPSYFNLVKVMVAYDNDPDQVSQILESAIRSVEGVQTEREVVAWLMELNEYQIVYWTAWWVATYQDRFAVQDRVIRAMMRALKNAGVILPYQKGRYDIDIDSERRGSKKEWDSGENQV